MTVTLLDSGNDTAATATKASNAFTPTAGALIVTGCYMTAHTTFDAGGCTSSITGYSFHRLEEHARGATSVNSCYWFVANQPAKNTSQTVTFNFGSDAGDGIAWCVYEITPATRFGMAAVRGAGIHNNFAAAATPSVTLDQAAVTTNPCFLFIGNGTNPGAVTAPTNFTRDVNTGYATPTTGFCANSRTSGHTASTITAGGTSATAGGAVGFEIDVTTSQTIKPVSAGTVPATTGTGTGTTSCAPDYPPDLLEGDIILLTVSIKPDTATAPDLSGSSFTQITNATGGTGSTGVDTGPTRLATYYRVAGASPPTGTLTVTPGSSPNCCWAHMRAYRSSHGASTDWDVAGTTGNDTSAGAAVSTAFAADPGIAIDDVLEVSFSTPTDVNLPGNFTRKYNDTNITGTGLAHGHISGDYASLFECSTTSGNDLGGQITRWFPTAALTSGVPTFVTTATGTTTNIAGPTALVRLRAAAGGTSETPVPGGVTVGGFGPTASTTHAVGGVTAGGTGPQARTTFTPGGVTVGGTGPVARTDVPPGGVIVGGNAPIAPTFETPVPGGVTVGGFAPTASVAPGVAGITVSGNTINNVRVPTVIGGATVGGTSPAPTVPSGTGTVVVGGNNVVTRTVLPQGGVLLSGGTTTARTNVTPGGVIIGGNPPGEGGGPASETPIPGGVTVGGFSPTARVPTNRAGITVGGTAPSASTFVFPGGVIIGGNPPTAPDAGGRNASGTGVSAGVLRGAAASVGSGVERGAAGSVGSASGRTSASSGSSSGRGSAGSSGSSSGRT